MNATTKTYRTLTMGRARHTITVRDGDNPPVFRIFRNYRNLELFVRQLRAEGYREI